MHFLGSPLDAYLKELGGELAGSSIGLDSKAPLDASHEDLCEEAASRGPPPTSPSLLERIVDETVVASAKIFMSEQLLPEHLVEDALVNPSTLSSSSTAFAFRLARGASALCGLCVLLIPAPRGSVFSRLSLRAYAGSPGSTAFWIEQCSRTCLAAGAIFELWHALVVARHVSLQRSVLREIADSSARLRAFWTTARQAVHWVQKAEPMGRDALHPARTQLRNALVASQDSIQTQVTTFCCQLQSLVDIRSGCLDDTGPRESHMPPAIALRSVLSQAWDLQTYLLVSSLSRLLEWELDSALRVLRELGFHADIAGCRIREELCFARSLQGLYETGGPRPLPSMRPWKPAAQAAHMAVCLALSVTSLSFSGYWCNTSEEICGLSMDFRHEDLRHFLDRVTPHVDAAHEALMLHQALEGKLHLGPSVPAEAFSSTANCAGASGTIEEASESQSFEPPCVSDNQQSQQPNGSGGHRSNVTIVHEGEGSPPECASKHGGIAAPTWEGDAAVASVGKHAWRSCLNELQELLAARGMPTRQIRGNSEQAMIPSSCKESVLDSWEAWGTVPLENPDTNARQRVARRSSSAATELMQALEIGLLRRRQGGDSIGDVLEA